MQVIPLRVDHSTATSWTMGIFHLKSLALLFDIQLFDKVPAMQVHDFILKRKYLANFENALKHLDHIQRKGYMEILYVFSTRCLCKPQKRATIYELLNNHYLCLKQDILKDKGILYGQNYARLFNETFERRIFDACTKNWFGIMNRLNSMALLNQETLNSWYNKYLADKAYAACNNIPFFLTEFLKSNIKPPHQRYHHASNSRKRRKRNRYQMYVFVHIVCL